MSRAERRAYKRMTRNQDAYALPAGAARPRRPRPGARPPAGRSGEFVFLSRRFLAWALGGGLLAGLAGFSVAWPNGMPMALYAGLGAVVVWLALATLFRFAQRRMAGAQG